VEIVDMPIGQIKPYKKNPRKNEKAIPEVVKSLKEFGFRQPLVVDSNMVLIVGHTRLLAAKELGHTTVPVHVASTLTPAQVKAYRIMDNRSGERAEWDRDLLLTEMDDIFTLDPKYDSDFLDFEIEEIDEKTDYKTYDVSEVQDEFVITIRGPLPEQATIRALFSDYEDNEDYKIEVSHVKQIGKK